MNLIQVYQEKVKLLLEVLPTITEPKQLGLQGGTLLNLFCLNMPRYSIDIDLIWLPSDSLQNLKSKGRKVFENIFQELTQKNYKIVRERDNLNFEVKKVLKIPSKHRPSGFYDTNVKIDVQLSYYKRQFLEPENSLRLAPNVRKKFGFDFAVKGISRDEIFANKLFVACSRQAPKDIFDAYQIKKELDLKNITPNLRKSLIYNFVSYDRGEPTMVYGLNPTIKNVKEARFNKEFLGINLEPFSYQDYLIQQKQNMLDIRALLTDLDKEFIYSIQRLEPRWDIYDFEDLAPVQLRLKHLLDLKENEFQSYMKDTENVFKALNNAPELKPRTYRENPTVN